MSNYFKSKKLTVASQISQMKSLHPQFTYKLINKGVVWVGEIQPTPLSIKYRVRIQYVLGEPPKITVLSPKLKLLEGHNRPPHTYSCGSLCLYTPGKGEWHGSLFIAATIVPWIRFWLNYYEGWLITEKWHGDGTEPNEGERL